MPKKNADSEELKEIHRQLRQALKDCHHLLEKTEQLIRRIDGQDTEDLQPGA